MDMSLPPFLHGCFDWRENGYHWNGPAPLDLLSKEALDSANPWISMASTVERAKNGDHGSAVGLSRFFDRQEPFALGRLALLIFADIAPTKELPALETPLRHADSRVRAFAAEAAALAGQLGLVPAMLQAWGRARTLGEHETIGFAISDVLDGEEAHIMEQVGVYDPPPPEGPVSEKEARLMARRAALFAEAEPPPLPGLVDDALAKLSGKVQAQEQVWQGALMQLGRLARKLLAIATTDEIDPMINLRHRFEAQTGLDCRPFFFAMKVQKLVIADAMERFLDSHEDRKYPPGVRHFWGHQIPS